jgi:ribosomal protein S18 acetylase RimI-like enzyme
LVIDAGRRREALGTHVVRALEDYLWQHSIDTLVLGVLDHNLVAGAFWTNLDYVRMDRISEQCIGGRPVKVRAYYKERPKV